MKILVMGAGAVGGYFGGRLLEKGEDVTFLVRKGRDEQLKENGLRLVSTKGDFQTLPKTVRGGDPSKPFDLIIVSTKAYHLDQAIEDLRGFVGPETKILPVLNGMAHMNRLEEAFGSVNVIGGLALIESTLDEKGHIVHTSPMNEIVYGARMQEQVPFVERLDQVFSETKADFTRSDKIDQEMWHKFLFITVMSGITSLMRAPLGPIRDVSESRDLTIQLLNECASAMRQAGAPILENIEELLLKRIDNLAYGMKSSMQRDIEKGSAIEADHLQGDLLRLAREGNVEANVLNTIYASLKVYEESLKEKHQV